MTKLTKQLEIERCPHCQVDKPNISSAYQFETRNHKGEHKRFWRVYRCGRCGGAILASASEDEDSIREMYPPSTEVDKNIPIRARDFLTQALNSIHAPDGSVMLAGSAVDAMLKEKGYKKGSLYDRINQAADDHLITKEMAQWAHEVRLDANEPRHADEEVQPPDETDARKCVDFTLALGQFLFVLPAQVTRGLKDATE